jgi:hypothetical protein
MTEIMLLILGAVLLVFSLYYQPNFGNWREHDSSESPQGYKTSKEGIKQIRRDLLRKTSLQDLEAMVLRSPTDKLALEVLEEAYIRVKNGLAV